MTMTDRPRVIEIPVTELQPFDGLHEGSYIARVTFQDVERYDPLTGNVSRQPVVTVTSCAAKTIVAHEWDGQHIHEYSHDVVDEKTFGQDATVRVSRPAVIAPCACENDPYA